MNTKKPSYEPEYVARNGATIKTVSLQVAVTEPDLQNAVQEAFALAKSGGRELNLAFSLQILPQSIPKQSDIRAAHLGSPRVNC